MPYLHLRFMRLSINEARVPVPHMAEADRRMIGVFIKAQKRLIPAVWAV